MIFVAVAILLLAYFASHGWTLLAVLTVALLALMPAVIRRLLATDASIDPRRRRVATSTSCALAGTGVALLLAWVLLDRSDSWAFLGACIFWMGVGQLTLEWRKSRWWAPWRGPVVGAVSVVLIAAGLVAATSLRPAPALALLGIGFLAAPVGLSVATEDVLDRVVSPVWPPGWAHDVVGGLMLVIGLAGMVVTVNRIAYVIVGVGALLLLVGAIASNTNADVMVLILVTSIAWSLAPSSVPVGEHMTVDDGETVIVALGDSFMSGEGAPAYFEGTNRNGSNECRRAPTAYPSLLAEANKRDVPDNVIFLACSGADAINIYEEAQYDGEPVGGPGASINDGGEPRGLAQLESFTRQTRGLDVEVAFVIVSIGGNDANFGSIAQTCILPGDCTELGQRWLTGLAGVDEKLAPAYTAIGQTFSNAPVLVVPYPVPLSTSGCGYSTLTDNEHRFLNGFTRELNKVIERAAARAHFHFVTEMTTALEDRRLRLCDGEQGRVGVNFFDANPVEGHYDPRRWFHNSLHPNRRGHLAMRDTLLDWIEDHPNLPKRAPPVRGSESTVPLLSLEELMADSGFEHCGRSDTTLKHCDGPVTEWAAARTAQFVTRITPFVLCVIAGSWLLWLGMLRWHRSTNCKGRRI